MIHQPHSRGRDGLEPSVRMLRKSRNLMPVIHSIGGVGVEIGAVAGEESFHFAGAGFVGGVVVIVVDAE